MVSSQILQTKVKLWGLNPKQCLVHGSRRELGFCRIRMIRNSQFNSAFYEFNVWDTLYYWHKCLSNISDTPYECQERVKVENISFVNISRHYWFRETHERTQNVQSYSRPVKSVSEYSWKVQDPQINQ